MWHSASVLFALIVAAGAQAPDTRTALQDSKRLTCQFTLFGTGTWGADGVPTGEMKAASLSLAFSKIDTQEGTAEIEGAFGAPPVVAQYSRGYLHFMQIGSTGFLYTTTVFNVPSRPGKLKAVHTRHEYTEVAIPGFTARPQQYYGECEIRPTP